MEVDFDIAALEELQEDTSSLLPFDEQAPSIVQQQPPVALQTRPRSNSNKRVLTPTASSDGLPSTSPGKASRSDLNSDVTLSRSRSAKHESPKPVELAPRFRTALTIHSDNSNDSSSANLPPPQARASKSSSSTAKIVSVPKAFSSFLAAESGTQFKCPFCPKAQMNEPTLVSHVLDSHRGENPRSVCPICAAGPGGDPNYKSQDIFGHLQARHRRGPSSSSSPSFLSMPMFSANAPPTLTPAPAASSASARKEADGSQDESASDDPSSSDQQSHQSNRRNDEGGIREWLLLEPQTLNVQSFLRNSNAAGGSSSLVDYLCAHDREVALIEREQVLLSCTYANHFAEERKYYESLVQLSAAPEAEMALDGLEKKKKKKKTKSRGGSSVNRKGTNNNSALGSDARTAPDVCSLCIEYVKSSESHAIFPCGHGMHSNCLPAHLHLTASPSCPLCFPAQAEEEEEEEEEEEKEHHSKKEKSHKPKRSSSGRKKEKEKEKEKEEEKETEKEKPEKPERRKSSRSHSKKGL